MIDLANICNQHRIFAFDAISDELLFDIPKIYGRFLDGYPLVE